MAVDSHEHPKSKPIFGFIWIPALSFTATCLTFLFVAFFIGDLKPDQRHILNAVFSLLAGFATFFIGGTAFVKLTGNLGGLKVVFSGTGGVAVFVLAFLHPIFPAAPSDGTAAEDWQANLIIWNGLPRDARRLILYAGPQAQPGLLSVCGVMVRGSKYNCMFLDTLKELAAENLIELGYNNKADAFSSFDSFFKSLTLMPTDDPAREGYAIFVAPRALNKEEETRLTGATWRLTDAGRKTYEAVIDHVAVAAHWSLVTASDGWQNNLLKTWDGLSRGAKNLILSMGPEKRGGVGVCLPGMTTNGRPEYECIVHDRVFEELVGQGLVELRYSVGNDNRPIDFANFDMFLASLTTTDKDGRNFVPTGHLSKEEKTRLTDTLWRLTDEGQRTYEAVVSLALK